MQCFSSTYNIASASAFYLSRPQKNLQNHPHFTRLKICRFADPQIRILLEAVQLGVLHCVCLNTTAQPTAVDRTTAQNAVV